MSSHIRTRFAPSPTGYLHVGGARTALFNWLYAKSQDGSFVLRIEDTDKERNTEEARQAIFEGLNWLGLHWDEGPEIAGLTTPYYQSQRGELYDKWFTKLQKDGHLYEDEGAWRFRFERKPISFQDAVCGKIEIDYRNEENTPDMVIKRSDGSYVFHFVNVVDDLEMQITDVIRGEDHLMNTPKHLQLFAAMGEQAPRYAHLPLLLNKDGSKMSKRDAGAAVDEYMQQGFLPEAVFNFLALLGWSPKDESELMDSAEIIKRFSLEAINRSPAKFDFKKCTWFNQKYLQNLPPENFAKAAAPFVQKAQIPINERYTEAATLLQQKVSLLSEVPSAMSFLLDSDFPYDSQTLEKVCTNAQVPELLQTLHQQFTQIEDWSMAKSAIETAATQHQIKPGQLMFPTRVALSGKSGGPDLGDILSFLGREETTKRIQRSLAFITKELAKAK